MAEASGKLATFDIEATGLKGDYNGVLVVSVKPFGQKPISLTCTKPGDDKKLVADARDLLSQYSIWVSYYGKMFDEKMLNTRLFYHGLKSMPSTLHLDLYWALKSKLLTARRSMAHYSRWMATPSQKMDMSPQEWNDVLANPKKHLPMMVRRCEADVQELEDLYTRSRHLIKEFTR